MNTHTEPNPNIIRNTTNEESLERIMMLLSWVGLVCVVVHTVCSVGTSMLHAMPILNMYNSSYYLHDTVVRHARRKMVMIRSVCYKFKLSMHDIIA